MPLRSVVPALLFVSLMLLAAPDAHAGSYSSPVCTGTATRPSYTHTPPAPYASMTSTLNGQSYSGWGGSGAGSGGDGSPGTCTGTIIAVFTWQPATGKTDATDPPPVQVIIKETFVAYASGNNFPATPVPGQCDNGIGVSQGSLTQTPLTSGSPPVAYGTSGTGFCSSTRYKVLPGLASMKLMVSPSASVGGNPGGGSTVIYNASISPLTLTVSLGGQNPANQALTGQQITATLNGVGALPSGTKITSYTWSFSGSPTPTVIKGWDGTNNTVQLTPWGPTDLSKTDTSGNGLGNVSSLSFYDQKAETATAKCVVNFTFLDGTTASVTATSVPVTFMKPTATWNAHLNDPPSGAVFTSTLMGYIERWDANITVPSPFSGGLGCFAQIVSPTVHFQRKPTGNQSIDCYLKVPKHNADGTTSYVLPTTGLDTVFP